MIKARTKKDWLVIAVTGIALLLLLAKLTNIGWKTFAAKPLTAVKAEQLSYSEGIVWAGSLFGAEPATPTAAKPVVTADIKVYGLISGSRGAATYALLLIDGQRREIFAVGEEVVPGLKVIEITPTSITLQSGSGETKIPIIEEDKKAQELIAKPGSEPAAPAPTSGLIMPGDATRSGRASAPPPAAPAPPVPRADGPTVGSPAANSSIQPAPAVPQKPVGAVNPGKPQSGGDKTPSSVPTAPIEEDYRG